MAKRILLVEDEPHIVESLTFLLEKSGFDVSVETSGRDALAHALSNPPDTLILDVMLPELDGYEVLRQLRSDDRTTQLPVLMLTAKGQREDREMAARCGADRFMTKPFANADLIDTVKELVNVGRD